MRIIDLTLVENGISSFRKFNGNSILITSSNNSKGKTTFIRLLLYSLGFQIPNMNGIDFQKIETKINFEIRKKQFCAERNGSSFSVTANGNTSHFNLPSEHIAFMQYVFDFENSQILENLLGVIYIDQDKGWSLLNRGTVVGKIKFQIENLCAGLNDENISDLLKYESELEYNKNRFLSVRNLQDTIDSAYIESGNLDIPEKQLELKNDILFCKIQRDNIKKQILDIQNIVNNQLKLGEYINSMKLRININGVDEIITSDRLSGFSDNIELFNARIKMLSYESEKLTRRIKELENQIDFENRKDVTNLFEDKEERNKRLMSEFNNAISSTQNAVEELLDFTSTELTKTRCLIREKVKTNNDHITKIYALMVSYAEKLGVLGKIGNSENYIFTRDLKTLSGSVLSKIIFSFKLAFLKVVQEKMNLRLPLIIDSPGSKELDNENLNKVFRLIDEELSDNQVFIASIHNKSNCSQRIELLERAIENEDMLQSLRQIDKK